MLPRVAFVGWIAFSLPTIALSQNDVRGQMEAYYRQRGPVLADSIRQLLAGPKLRFVEYVALENVVLEEPEVLARSGELQYQRLLLVARAEEAGRNDTATLARYWRLSHAGELQHSDFDAVSFPRSKPFWAIIDRFPTASWAEEAAWHAARLRQPSDECYPECIVELFVNQMYRQYWSRFPKGPHVAAALDSAIGKMAMAVEMTACATGGDHDFDFPVAKAAGIRQSLRSVTDPTKARLLELLEAGIAKCRKTPLLLHQ